MPALAKRASLDTASFNEAVSLEVSQLAAAQLPDTLADLHQFDDDEDEALRTEQDLQSKFEKRQFLARATGRAHGGRRHRRRAARPRAARDAGGAAAALPGDRVGAAVHVVAAARRPRRRPHRRRRPDPAGRRVRDARRAATDLRPVRRARAAARLRSHGQLAPHVDRPVCARLAPRRRRGGRRRRPGYGRDGGIRRRRHVPLNDGRHLPAAHGDAPPRCAPPRNSSPRNSPRNSR